MNKNKISALLALAVAGMAGASAVHAQSTVQFSGIIDVYAGSLQRSGEKDRTAVTNSSGMSTSWWGFKGVEDLGGDLKANFNLTGFFRPDVGGMGRHDADTLFSRDANVGLSGKFGRISLGRDLAPNFVPSISLTPFGGSFPFSPLLLHTQTGNGGYKGQKWAATVAGDTGWSNEIMYVTPNMSGLTASLFLQLGEQAGNNSKNNVGANAMYNNGPLTLGAYYQQIKLKNPTDPTIGDSALFNFTLYNKDTGAINALPSAKKQDTWFIGGAYDFNVTKLFATYQQTKNQLPNQFEDVKSKTLQLGASAPLGNGVAMLSWAHTTVKANGDYSQIGAGNWTQEIKRNTVAAGYDYLLSKRTDIYTVVMIDKITDESNGKSFGVGIRHKW